MRDIECVVPRAAFMESGGGLEILALARFERGIKCPVHVQRPQCPVLWTVIMPVPEGRLHETLCVPAVPEGIGKEGKGMVGDIVFEGMGDGIVTRKVGSEHPQRDVPALDIRVYVGPHPVLRPRCGGGLDKSLVGRLYIKVLQALEPGVGNDRDGRVTLHGECLPAVQLPFRHPAPFLIYAYHGAHHV